MLTLKQLRDDKQAAIRKLAKKHVDAEPVINRIEELDDERKAVQAELDACLAQQNTAALEIERGADDAGIARLQKINTPEAWNNLGVAYAKKKEYQQALDYFGKAANAGVKAAAQNRDELSKWLDEQ